MNSHKNARLTVKGRERLIRRIAQIGTHAAALEAGISVRTAFKWKARFAADGLDGLLDRSSRPRQLRCALRPAQRQQALELRRLRLTIRAVAQSVNAPASTVRRALASAGLSRLPPLEPPKPIQRYEREAPGDLLHLDIKKLGRIIRPGHRMTGNPRDHISGAGWECVQVAIDDHSRVAFSQAYPDERIVSVVAFLKAALAYYQSLGVTIRRILTDNGPAYRSRIFFRVCRELGITHKFTRPYSPQTNGKAERFIQTALREWAYAQSYDTSTHRTAALDPWLHQYNYHRPHSAIGFQPPISRIPMNNLSNINI